MNTKWISSLLLAGVVSMTGCANTKTSTVADVPAGSPSGPGPITAAQDPSFGSTGPVALKAGPTPAATYGAPNTAPTDTFTLGTPAPAAPVAAAPLAGGNYVVRQGDTLWSISRAHYGTGQRWKDIVNANPGLSPEKMPVGRPIVLP